MVKPTQKKKWILIGLIACAVGILARAASSQNEFPNPNPEEALNEFLYNVKLSHSRLVATPVTVCQESSADNNILIAKDCSISNVGELDPSPSEWGGEGSVREEIEWYVKELKRISSIETLSMGPGHTCESLGCSGWDTSQWSECLGVDCAPVAVPEGRVSVLLGFGLVLLGHLKKRA